MRMSRHEQLRRIGIEHGAHGVVIIAGIATNMLDEHINILALETVQLAIHQAQVTAVAVAADGTERADAISRRRVRSSAGTYRPNSYAYR